MSGAELGREEQRRAEKIEQRTVRSSKGEPDGTRAKKIEQRKIKYKEEQDKVGI